MMYLSSRRAVNVIAADSAAAAETVLYIPLLAEVLGHHSALQTDRGTRSEGGGGGGEATT